MLLGGVDDGAGLVAVYDQGAHGYLGVDALDVAQIVGGFDAAVFAVDLGPDKGLPGRVGDNGLLKGGNAQQQDLPAGAAGQGQGWF